MKEVIAWSHHSYVLHAALINVECLITHINGKGITSLEMLFPKVNILC